MARFTICGIAGSLRRESLNRALLSAVADAVSDLADVRIASIEGVPLYNADIEAAEGIPPAVASLADEIRGADALLIVTPEYNAGIPGVLKNALDWISRVKPSVFAGRPTAMMGASPGRLGTPRAQMQLRNNLANLDARVTAQPAIYVGGADRLVGPDGTGLDEDTAEFIRRHVTALGELVSD